MRRSMRTGIGIGIVVLVIGLGTAFLMRRPLSVPVAASVQDVALRVYGLGTVEARILARIGFEAGAGVTDLAADAGDHVTRGQVLAQLSTVEQEARVARARAALTAARASLAKAKANVARAGAVLAQREAANLRQQELAGRSTISAQSAEESQRDVDVARADQAVAVADVAVVQAQAEDAAAALSYEQALLAQRALRAPFDAVIVERHAEAGDVVRAGDAIFTLIDPATIWILAYIDEERAGALALGQTAEIRLRSLPHQTFSGEVARIGLESDRINEERRVWLTCTDCPTQMFLGEQAEVRITLGQLSQAVMVPEIAINGFDGHTGRVWVVNNGKLAQLPLTFGARSEDARVEVVAGLPDGAKIVSAPIKGLTEGRLVRATTPEAGQ
ncbi:efflux RND transporter periplasmic adaptor subunit [Phaeovulum sp.]|uniref:efflux RND transporter periplasmic adaptor subunit n=1 Tax=Phaeovulum sp. TaxID=2934796 RepID=UPI0039E47512